MIRQSLVYALTVLRAHVQHAHWNFSGSEFMSVHPYLGDEVLPTVNEMLDWVAEDMRRHGEFVNANLEMASSFSTLRNVPPADRVTIEYLSVLADLMNEVCEMVYSNLADFNPSEQSTLTAFTDKLEIYAKLWFAATLSK